jgi:hypothetical protein
MAPSNERAAAEADRWADSNAAVAYTQEKIMVRVYRGILATIRMLAWQDEGRSTDVENATGASCGVVVLTAPAGKGHCRTIRRYVSRPLPEPDSAAPLGMKCVRLDLKLEKRLVDGVSVPDDL